MSAQASVATMKLELVPLPVADVDRAKAFYVDQVGFHADHDVRPNDSLRICQLTPPGSACSIVIGSGMGTGDVPSGSVRGLHLVVDNVAHVRDQLAARGVAVSAIEDMGGILYVHFSDPDGNTWALQQIPAKWR